MLTVRIDSKSAKEIRINVGGTLSCDIYCHEILKLSIHFRSKGTILSCNAIVVINEFGRLLRLFSNRLQCNYYGYKTMVL